LKCILAKFRKDRCAGCNHLCQHRIALEGLDGKSGRLGAAGLPAEYRRIMLDNSPARESQAKIYELLEQYVETFSRRGDDNKPIKSLYLWSESPGTGKTTTAAALIHEWIARDYLDALKEGRQPLQMPAYFLDLNDFQTRYNLASMTSDEAEFARIKSEIRRVQKAPFAVLDDVGVRNATEAFRAYLHAIINYRVTNRLPTVYTSNLPIEELARVFDERLYDRIRDMTGVIKFAGESKRGMRR